MLTPEEIQRREAEEASRVMGRAFRGLQQGVDQVRESFQPRPTTPPPEPNSMVFPSVLASIESVRPVIEITCIGGNNNGGKITLPCPVGFGVTDGASYNDTELGFLGNIAFEQITNLRQEGASFASLNEGLGNLAGRVGNESFLETAKNFAAAQFNRGIAGLAESTGFGKGIAVAAGALLNKNVTTEFTGMGTRNFAFQYKLVPSSQEEGVVIGQITRFLRQGIYPSKSVAESVLKYPPRWKIEFLTKINGATLTSIPRIAECYLESFQTTYNGSNSFHSDGVPVDTDISLTFKEFRALTLEDIDKLESEEGLAGDIGTSN